MRMSLIGNKETANIKDRLAGVFAGIREGNKDEGVECTSAEGDECSRLDGVHCKRPDGVDSARLDGNNNDEANGDQSGAAAGLRSSEHLTQHVSVGQTLLSLSNLVFYSLKQCT